MPPLQPKKEIVKIFCFFACFNTLIIFCEFPEVDSAISTSPSFPSAERFLEKIFEKPKSFPHAVIVDVS